MAIRVDSASFSGTGICVGGSGLGVKGSVIRATTGTGTHGEGLLYDDWDSAADDNKEFRAAITSWPGGATLFVHEDGSFALTGADGSYTIGYRLDIDGVSQGTTSETVNVGVLTAQQDFAASRSILAAVEQDFAATRDLLAANAVQQDFAASRTVLAAVETDFAGARAVLTAVETDFAAARGLLAAVATDHTATRTVLGAVQQDLAATREIEAAGQVSADFAATRAILAAVLSDFSGTRELLAPISVQQDFAAARFIAQIVYADFVASRTLLPLSNVPIAPSCYAEWATTELEVSVE